jgi:hypothetical protein
LDEHQNTKESIIDIMFVLST